MTIPCTQNKCTKPVMHNFTFCPNNKPLLCSYLDTHETGASYKWIGKISE